MTHLDFSNSWAYGGGETENSLIAEVAADMRDFSLPLWRESRCREARDCLLAIFSSRHLVCLKAGLVVFLNALIEVALMLKKSIPEIPLEVRRLRALIAAALRMRRVCDGNGA